MGEAVGAAMAGLIWNRVKNKAAAAARVAQVVLTRGFRVLESWDLGFLGMEDKALMTNELDGQECDDGGVGLGGFLNEREENDRGNDGRW